MKVVPPDLVVPPTAPAAGPTSVRVLSGDLSLLPVGSLLAATVTRPGVREAVLTVNGLQLAIRPGTTLQPGTVLVVRVPPGSKAPALELVGQAPAPESGQPGSPVALATGTPTPRASPEVPAATERTVRTTTPTADRVPPSANPAAVSVADVLTVLPDGRVRVRIDGAEEVATAAGKLVPGGRYVVRVERTPETVFLRPAADTPDLPVALAGAVLRGAPPPNLAAALQPLLTELVALRADDGTLPAKVREAAAAVQETLRTFLPPDGRPPAAGELRNLVENGGLHFEAKLARLVLGDAAPDALPAADRPGSAALAPTPADAREAAVREALRALLPTAAKPVDATAPRSPTEPPAPQPDAKPVRSEPAPAERPPPADAALPRAVRGPVGSDLKGDLLRLLQAVQEVGTAVAPAPAARAALDGIEAQQAANVVAQSTGTPYFLQVPFPDGGAWRTLHLALEPDARRGRQGETGDGGVRLLMHVPLAELGDTWVDAGVSGERFRAVLYLEAAETRNRVRAELPGLRDELRADGFAEVHLDVRATADLPARHRKQGAAMVAGRPDTVTVVDVRA
ncbi:MAG: hypothetical protein C0501_16705 [Isosphaera sp.]|nr:hypothetical protein [Isosphaera sp.]